MIKRLALCTLILAFCWSLSACVNKRVVDDTNGRVTYGHIE